MSYFEKTGEVIFSIFVLIMFIGISICMIVGTIHLVRNGVVSTNPRAPAVVARDDTALIIELAELASSEHKARVALESTLDETRKQAAECINKLLEEVQRLNKKPTAKPGGLTTAKW